MSRNFGWLRGNWFTRLMVVRLFAVIIAFTGCVAGDIGSGDGSGGRSGSGGSSGCDDCLNIDDLFDEYRANSYSAKQKYRGTRHNFSGVVEAVDQDSAVPPRPLVRLKSSGEYIVFKFDWGENYDWISKLRKGDKATANCRIARLDHNLFDPEDITLYLEKCTQYR